MSNEGHIVYRLYKTIHSLNISHFTLSGGGWYITPREDRGMRARGYGYLNEVKKYGNRDSYIIKSPKSLCYASYYYGD